MAVKNLRQRIVAFVAGLLLGPTVVWAGLESATYISDLVASNPLSSDLASTADDHIRLLKSTIKTTFPNINNAVTVTDEQLNAVGASGVTGAANPTGTVGLTAVNGSATTFMRSDGAPALSQAIAPTWTAQHTFSKAASAGSPAMLLSSSFPRISLNDSDGTADNRLWQFSANSDQLTFATENDANNAGANWLTVDRTGTTVDRVAFQSEAAGGFYVGTVGGSTVSLANIRTTNAARYGLLASHAGGSAGVGAIVAHHENTSGDNLFIEFRTEANAGTVRGTIDFNRGGTATRYNTTSDERLKKNFLPAPSARGVIDCIRVESYDWKETGTHVDHGFVAQRLNECAPYAVSSSTDPAKIWGVDPSKLVPALIKYVQEQDARIAELERAQSRH